MTRDARKERVRVSFERREIARTLNADRRHMTIEQRREVVAALREDGHSYRAIAGAVGVSKSVVADDAKQLSGSGQLPERVTGLDGKSRPAKREPKPAALERLRDDLIRRRAERVTK